MILKEAGWFYCDVNYATAVLKDVYKNYKKYLESTRKQTQYIKENFTLELMKEKFKTMMNEEISKRPKQVELKLPKLETTNA